MEVTIPESELGQIIVDGLVGNDALPVGVECEMDFIYKDGVVIEAVVSYTLKTDEDESDKARF